MKRTARDKRERPHPPPVKRIELNEEHIGRRLITAGVLLVLGLGLLAYAVLQLLTPETGWTEIEAGASVGTSCGEDFTFFYYAPTSAERRAVSTQYTQLCRSAYQMFHSGEEFEETGNVRTINLHPNQTVKVEPGLYRALEVMERSGSRLLYLGPVYDRYDDLFFCVDDSQIVDFDPRLNEDIAQEYREIAAFARDPEAVRIELLGDNQVRLYVSTEYLAYAGREEIDDFIGFSWTANAFIADYLAQELTALGYTRGTLTSYDGFIRNLDGSGTEYSVQLYDCQKMAEAIVYGITGQQIHIEETESDADREAVESGEETTVGDNRRLKKVQLGAYYITSNAEAVLARAKAAGFDDAIIVNA